LTVQEEETADDLLGFGERTVDDGALAAANRDPHSLGVGPERLAELESSAGRETLGEAVHAVVGCTPLCRRSIAPHVPLFHDQQQVRHDTPPIRGWSLLPSPEVRSSWQAASPARAPGRWRRWERSPRARTAGEARSLLPVLRHGERERAWPIRSPLPSTSPGS